jgi:Antitoxin ParD
MEKSMSRLTIDITDQQHQNLKAMAALQGKSIKQYTLERLFPENSEGDQDWSELQSLLGARIAEGLAGKLSPHSVEEILNEELQRDNIN